MSAYAPKKNRNFWKLKELTGEPDAPKRRQTWQEQLAIMQSWSARLDRQRANRP